MATRGNKHVERVAIAVQALAALKPHGAVTAELSKRFGVAERTARKYVAAARAQLAAEAAERAPQLRDYLQRELLDVYAAARAKGDLKHALGALAQLARAFGLDAPERLEVGGNVSIGELSEGAVLDRIRELSAKHLHLIEHTDEGETHDQRN